MVEIVGMKENETGNPDNWGGAGVAESIAQFVDSMGRAKDGDIGEVAMNGAAVGLDVLGLVLDPVGSLATAGIGWLIEHVSFLREPLDWFAGSPDKIKQASATWNEVAMQLDDIGKQQEEAVRTQAKAWEKAAAEAFRKSQGELGNEMRAVGAACTAVSSEIAGTGTIVATVRGMIRDLISTFIYEVIRNAVIALAGSAATFGAAAAAFAAWTVGRAAMVLGKIAKQVAKVIQVVMRIMGRLKGLFSKIGDLMKGLKRFGKSGGSTPDAPAPTRATGATDSAPKPSAGQRMEDWGRQKADSSNLGQKAKDAADAYKDTGNQWKRMYEDKMVGQKAAGVSDQYAPYKPKESPDGSVTAHSRPDSIFAGGKGGFETKFSGDLLREGAKDDELQNETEVPPEVSLKEEKAIKEAESQRVEELRAQDERNR